MPTINDARTAAEQGNLQQARLIFEAILQENPRTEDAWLGLADVLTETNEKRICYENALKINKNNRVAREGLRGLEPQEDPFVQALKQQTTTMPAEEDLFPAEDLEETAFSPGAATVSETATAKTETPTVVLVAVGLGLSVMVFALGAGLVFFFLNRLLTP
jgi:hypothetical protein